MSATRPIDDAERRARLGRRHALAAPVATAEDAAAAVVALHSSDPISVHLSARARTGAPSTADVERALYDDRTLVRMHGMRRTLWVVPRDLEPAMRIAAGRPLVAPDRKRLLAALAEGDVDDVEIWLDALADEVVAAVEEAGEATAVELGRAVPGLATKVLYGRGTKWPTEVSVASRLLTILGFEGRIVRARPLGSWISGQYRYTAGSALDRPPDPTPEVARAAIVGAYVERFGPVTEADVRWWTGWTVAHVRAAVAACGAVEVALDGGVALVAEGDTDPVGAPEPWVALLPGLDPTTMGWRGRDWYLGDLGPVLFDRNGNAGPTVWAGGCIVGGWAQRPDGSIAVDVRADVGAEALDTVAAEAERLATWFAGVVATPRFRTPLERALVAGTDPP